MGFELRVVTFAFTLTTLTAAFAGLGFFGFWLAGKMHLFDQRGHTVKAWLALIPFTAASLVALTRVMDYRHHPTE